MAFIFWLEGVDFSQNLYDTNDLSTVRGASLTLLAAAGRAREILIKALDKDSVSEDSVSEIFSGASQGAWMLKGDESDVVGATNEVMTVLATQGLEPRPKGKTPPFAHMRFVCGLAEIKDEDEKQALEQAAARARFAQLQKSGTRRPPAQISEICAIDRTRPANSKEKVKGKAASKSAAARHFYGRLARQAFYERELEGDKDKNRDEEKKAADEAVERQGQEDSGPQVKFDFAASFEELVKNPPQGEAFPETMTGKIAVFYADGDKFGGIRADLDKIKELTLFSQNLKTKMQKKLLAPLITDLHRIATPHEEAVWKQASPVSDGNARKWRFNLRLETLLWGGDELMMVVPAWLGWWLAQKFYLCVDGWKFEEHPLKFSSGLVFCHHKTPIRDATKLAKDLCEMAKGAGGDRLEFEVMESIDIPLDGIAGMRKRLLGLDGKYKNALAIKARQFRDEQKGFLARAEELKKDFPRSQLYNILRKAQRTAQGKRQLLADSGKEAESALKHYLDHTGQDKLRDKKLLELASRSGLNEEEGKNLLPLDLYLLTEIWDYIGPFPKAGSTNSQYADTGAAA